MEIPHKNRTTKNIVVKNMKEYRLTASLAKKLAMQSKTNRGEEARCYFIACEQALVKVALERQKWEIECAKGVMIATFSPTP